MRSSSSPNGWEWTLNMKKWTLKMKKNINHLKKSGSEVVKTENTWLTDQYKRR
jgi:hypothetical protein